LRDVPRILQPGDPDRALARAAPPAGAGRSVADDPHGVHLEQVGRFADSDGRELHAMHGTVAALYVDPKGVYSDLEGVEVWDEAKDARLYAGPWPVVAHPPCARWCALAGQIERRYGLKVGDDGGCFASALAAVRRYGGVLEHPAYSLAWKAFRLPRPLRGGGWCGALDDPGWSCHVEQGHYGHAMRKGTWLYAVGVELPTLEVGRGPGFVRAHRFDGLSETQRKRLTIPTPPAFRDVLLSVARSSVLTEARRG
jgi:hypothetical protein